MTARMGKGHRIIIPRWAKRFVFVQIEPFAALFWALGIVISHILQQVTQPVGLAFPNYGTARQWKVGFNLTDEALPPPISPLGVLTLW